jgi:hypothetical protein
MATKIVSVRFSQSLDMLKIGGGHSTVVSNEVGANMPTNGVKATVGVGPSGEKGLILRKEGAANYMWMPFTSSILAAVLCTDEPEPTVKK